MTKFITALIIALVLFAAWNLYLYWEKVKQEEEMEEKKAAATAVVPEQLPGLPYTLEQSLNAAQNQGVAGLESWLKTYGHLVQDPRKAWIELDYALLISRSNPSEAKRLFKEIKERTPATSPVYPRIKQLEKTYE